MNTTQLTLAALLVAAGLGLAGCADTLALETEGQPTTVADAPLVLAQASAKEASGEAAKEADKAKPNADDAPITRPKADRTPRKPGEAIRITFDHIILGMQKDMVFRPWMLNDDVKELDGQRVSITGVMHDNVATLKNGNKWFVLLRNKECKYGPGGQADHLAEVELRPGNSIKYTHETLRVEGKLKIAPKMGDDGNTISLYVLEDATVKVQ
jgi:hypothetical protein